MKAFCRNPIGGCPRHSMPVEPGGILPPVMSAPSTGERLTSDNASESSVSSESEEEEEEQVEEEAPRPQVGVEQQLTGSLATPPSNGVAGETCVLTSNPADKNSSADIRAKVLNNVANRSAGLVEPAEGISTAMPDGAARAEPPSGAHADDSADDAMSTRPPERATQAPSEGLSPQLQPQPQPQPLPPPAPPLGSPQGSRLAPSPSLLTPSSSLPPLGSGLAGKLTSPGALKPLKSLGPLKSPGASLEPPSPFPSKSGLRAPGLPPTPRADV